MTEPRHEALVAAPIATIRAAIAEGREPQSLVTPLWERAKMLEPRLCAFAHLPDNAPSITVAFLARL